MFGVVAFIVAVIIAYVFHRWYGSALHAAVAYGTNETEKRIGSEAACLLKAVREIKMKHGELNRRVSGNKQLLGTLKRVLDEKREVKLRVLVCPQLDVGGRDFYKLALAYPGRIEFRLLKSREMPHFDIVDDRYVLVEGEHEAFQTANGYVGRADRAIIEKLEQFFDRLWETAERINLREEIEKARVLRKSEITKCLLENEEPACKFGFVDYSEECGKVTEILPASAEHLDSVKGDAMKQPEELQKELEESLVSTSSNHAKVCAT